MSHFFGGTAKKISALTRRLRPPNLGPSLRQWASYEDSVRGFTARISGVYTYIQRGWRVGLYRDICLPQSPNFTWRVTSRNVTSRHDKTRCLAHAFWHWKKPWRAVSRLSHSTVRHACCTSRYSATHTTCVQGRRHSVDWGGHVHLTFFSRSCSWDWCTFRAQNTKHVHASTAFSSSAILEQARHDTHDKRDTLVTTRMTRRDVTQQVEFGINLSSISHTQQWP